MRGVSETFKRPGGNGTLKKDMGKKIERLKERNESGERLRSLKKEGRGEIGIKEGMCLYEH